MKTMLKTGQQDARWRPNWLSQSHSGEARIDKVKGGAGSAWGLGRGRFEVRTCTLLGRGDILRICTPLSQASYCPRRDGLLGNPGRYELHGR